MNKLIPKNWIKTTLAEIAIWSSGGTPSRANLSYYNGNIPWIKTGDMNDGLLTHVDEFITETGLKNSSAKVFPKGSVAIAMYGATIGKTAILGIDAATNQACAVAQTYNGVSNKYLFYYLRSEKQNFVDKGKGGAQPNISQAVIKDHPFPLAPTNEQIRISNKLDQVFTHFDCLKTKLDRIPELIKAVKEKILTQAVTGNLTIGWRSKNDNLSGKKVLSVAIETRKKNWEDAQILQFKTKGKTPTNEDWKKKYPKPFNLESKSFDKLPESWAETVWDQISDWITYGFTRPMPHIDEGLPIITGKNVVDGKINFSNVHFTSLKAFENLNSKDKPKKGDILLTKDGTIGRAAVVEAENVFCINQSVAVIWLNNSPLNRKYLLYVIMCDVVQKQIKLHTKGVAVQHLSVTDFRKMHLPIPPIEEQNEIVRKVEELFNLIEKIELRYNLINKKIENLPTATLAKAFKGELIKQDKNDESAEELLKRIIKSRTIAKL